MSSVQPAQPARLIHEIRAKYPGLAKRADAGSKQSAIRLFCLECSGDNPTVARSCTVTDCPLWGSVGRGWGKVRSDAVGAISAPRN